jgi:hypothetical protein
VAPLATCGPAPSVGNCAGRQDPPPNLPFGVAMKLGTQIKRVTKIDADGFRVSLEYADGFRCTVNLSFLFDAPKKKPLVLEILRGALFDSCFVDNGALAWPNGYELCPDAIRGWLVKSRHRAA